MVKLPQGHYTAIVTLEDYAGNELTSNTWNFHVDYSAPTPPVIDVTNIDDEYGFYNNMFFVNTNPEIELQFFENVSINVSLKSDNQNLSLNCSSADNLNFECDVPEYETMIDGDYVLDILAYKINEDGTLFLSHPGIYDYTTIVYDTISPSFDALEIPTSMQPNDIRGFIISVLNTEYDVITEIKDDTNPTLFYDIPDMVRVENNYSALLDSEFFGWMSSDIPYKFNITVFDRAMNKLEKNYSIIIDSDAPEIYITSFESDDLYINTTALQNITTANANISLEGYVNDTEINSICLNISNTENPNDINFTCQYPCEYVGQENCIDFDGEFQFDFQISFDSVYNYGEEIWNFISLIATDAALNMNSKKLSALLDLKPPELISVSVS
jgi:hypothetical protein